MKAFSYTGLIHILSISGSHIALLLALVYGLGRLIKLRKRTCLILGIIVACIYCGIVGGDAPVLRATMMSILMCIAYIKDDYIRPNKRYVYVLFYASYMIHFLCLM